MEVQNAEENQNGIQNANESVQKAEENQNGKTNANESVQERYLELQKQIGSQEIRIQNLQNSAFQLANYYFVFQGVILAAIFNSTSLACSDSVFIFILSLIAALLNLSALLNIAKKYVQAMDMHDQTWYELNSTAAFKYLSEQRPDSLEYTGEYLVHNNYKDHFARGKRYVVLTICMLMFLGFTATTLSGLWLVRCKHDHQLQKNQHRLPGPDCLKLCDESSSCMFFFQAMHNP